MDVIDVTIEDNQTSCFKLTITSSNDVRIKVQKDVDDDTRQLYVKWLRHVAQEVVREGLNKQTLRGKCKDDSGTITLDTDSKKPVRKFKF